MLMTLFDACVLYIAKHIHLVESFEGYPDLIGKKIFKAAHAVGKFSTLNGSSLQALSLFTSAYLGSVLHSVCLEGEHLALANCIQHLQLFTHLKILNVSSCGLGDDHELLHHISKLSRLQVLALHDNALTDTGIRKMTAPVRVMKAGPLQLLCLDLSENVGISASSLKYLQVFQRLLFLDLTATAVRHSQVMSERTVIQERLNCMFQSDAKEFAIKMALEPRTAYSNLGDLLNLGTRGWAADVVQSWIVETQQKCHTQSSKSAQKSSDSTRRFYGKKAKPMAMLPAGAGSASAVPFSKQQRRHTGTLVFVCQDFAECLPSLKKQIMEPQDTPDHSPPEENMADVQPQSAVSLSHKFRTEHHLPSGVHDQHMSLTEPPAKVRKVDRKCDTPAKNQRLQKPCVIADKGDCEKQETLSDEDAILLRQYGFSGI